jgi:hypothetical protein
MHEFLSWIQKDGHIYTITDTELGSSRGVSLRKQYRGHNLFSVQFLRQYYGLIGGKAFCAPEFWKIAELPPTLVFMVANFERYWGKALQGGCMPLEELFRIQCEAPPDWQERVFVPFLKLWREENLAAPEQATAVMLRRVVAAFPKKAAVVAQTLVECCESNDVALAVADPELPDETREWLWEGLCSSDVPINAYRSIVENAPEARWKNRAVAMLAARGEVPR